MYNNNLTNIYNLYIKECESVQRLRPETIRGYRHVLETFFKRMPEITSIESINPEVLTEFFSIINTRQRIVGKDKKKIGIKDSTAQTYWLKLNKFFNWVEMKYSIENPLKYIAKPKARDSDRVAVTNESIHKILSAITQRNLDDPFIALRDRTMIYLLKLTGLRKGELLGLEVRDIDLENKLITIRGETSKSGRTRVLVINDELLEILKVYIKERRNKKYKVANLIVNSQKDTRLTAHGLKHWVKRYREESGVAFHLHQFRHNFATSLEDKNVTASKIQKMLGHQDLRMTMKYLRSSKAEDFGNDINLIRI